MVSIGMAPTSEHQVHGVEGAIRRERVRNNIELVRLAALLGQCGGCLTTLAGMIPGAKAESEVVIVGKEITEQRHSDMYGHSMFWLWLFSVILGTLCYEMFCRCRRRMVSVGTQTDDHEFMAERTLESLRAEARHLDLATSGTKLEMIGRLIRHRHRG